MVTSFKEDTLFSGYKAADGADKGLFLTECRDYIGRQKLILSPESGGRKPKWDLKWKVRSRTIERVIKTGSKTSN